MHRQTERGNKRLAGLGFMSLKLQKLPNNVEMTFAPMKYGEQSCTKAYVEYNRQYFPISLICKALSDRIVVTFTFAGCKVQGVLLKRDFAKFIVRIESGQIELAIALFDQIIFNEQVCSPLTKMFDLLTQAITNGWGIGLTVLVEGDPYK
jgi:hypothetical protein